MHYLLPGPQMDRFGHRALLDHGTQPNELVHPSIRFDARASFETVERRGADGARNNLALIEHGELNDHSIEVVAQNLTLLKRHCKSSVLKVGSCLPDARGA